MAVNSYGSLLRTPSVGWLLGTSILGRFNQGMTGLALLLLVTQHSTYAVAGVVSACYLAGAFVAGPMLTRLADRRGRRPVLAVSAVAFAVAMAVLATIPARPILLCVVAAIAGLSVPPVTASVRAVLPAIVGAEQRRSVFALESTLQELIFILGPPTTALLAALGGPRLAVAAAGALVLIGTLGFIRDPQVEAGRHTGQAHHGHVLKVPGIPGVVAAGTAIVAAFSAETVGVVELVSGRHASSGSAFVLAATSLGSAIGGLVYGSRNRHRAELRHLLVFVAAGLAVVLTAPNRPVLVVLLFCWGLTIAPALSRLFERLAALAPPAVRTEAFGWMGSGLTVGSALGSALGGFAVTLAGGRAAIGMAVLFIALAALVAEPWPALRRRISSDVDQRAEHAAPVGEHAECVG
ncbi:MAG: MFS transporter [Acidothermus sp.]|nr:MFS transporter [Acidothermus sp.]MCL6538820.1 MFS transporter [Acidothermus sp.]